MVGGLKGGHMEFGLVGIIWCGLWFAIIAAIALLLIYK
jgi:uncharacterized RDD family membrane protein YckC